MHQNPTAFQVDGAAICRKRMQAGMSVRQLASHMGCTPNYLRKIERGIRQCLSPEFYVRLRDALHESDSELLL